VQNVRGGRPPLVVSLSLASAQTPVAQLKSDQPVATGQVVTKPILPGIYYTQALTGNTVYGLAFDPIAVGSTSVTVSAPGMLTMTASGVRPVTISGPGINPPVTQTVGAGLQLFVTAQLGASEHNGVTVTVQSTNPARVLVSPDGVAPGTASFTRSVANGETFVSYYVQGLENTSGSAQVNISAPGFANASHQVDLSPAGIELHGVNPAMDTLSADDVDVYVQVGVPCPDLTTLCAVQNVRSGAAPLVATLSLASTQTPIAELRSDQPVAAGQTVTKPIQPGIYYTQAIAPGTFYGLTFDPISTGSTTVTVTGPAGVITMSTTGVRPVTISGPTVSAPGTIVAGAGLQAGTNALLSSSNHNGVIVTVSSSNPSIVRLSPDGVTAGTGSILLPIANGNVFVPYFVQGMENVTGSATITVNAPGFGTATHTVNVVPAGIEILSLDPNTSNLSPDDIDWYVQVGLPCPDNTTLCAIQVVRAGGPAFIATITNSSETVARLRSDEPTAIGQTVTKPIQPGIYYTQAVAGGTFYGLTFDPLANGTTTVSVTGPTGVITMTSSGVRPITVTTPSIQLFTPLVNVGAGLQVSTGAVLSAAQHGGVTVTVTSSAPNILLVSTDPAVEGEDSVGITMPNETTFLAFTVQALENVTGTAIVTLSAPGFTSATMEVRVRPSGIEVHGLPTSISEGAPDATGWYVMTGLPSLDFSFLEQIQVVRAGSPGFVIRLANSTAQAAQLGSDEPAATGQVVFKPIRPGIYYTQEIPGGTPYGLRFDPLAVGTTTVTATGPIGVVSMPLSTRTIVVVQ
jgi:hypothetical protein